MDGPSFQYWYGASFVLTVLSFATRADSTPLLLPVAWSALTSRDQFELYHFRSRV